MARGRSLVESCNEKRLHSITAQWLTASGPGMQTASLLLEKILLPSSRRKLTADSLIGPSVSTAIGWNEYEAGRSEYSTSLLEAAASAAAAAVTEEAGR